MKTLDQPITLSDDNFQLPTHELARMALKLSISAFKAEALWGFEKGKHVALNIPTIIWEDEAEGSCTSYKDCGIIAEAISHFNLSNHFNSKN